MQSGPGSLALQLEDGVICPAYRKMHFTTRRASDRQHRAYYNGAFQKAVRVAPLNCQSSRGPVVALFACMTHSSANATVLRLLSRGPFARYIAGETVSMIGTWMQLFAQGYLLTTLTSQASVLGAVHFAAGLPMLLLTASGSAALILMTLGGGGTSFGIANTIIQERAPDQMRGRVSAVAGLSFFGILPFSGLVMSALADGLGCAWRSSCPRPASAGSRP